MEKCKLFLDRVFEKTGVRGYLYTNDARATKYDLDFLNDYKFWIARYGKNDGTKSKEPVFKNWDIWQFTSKGRVKGIDGYVDLNEAKTPPASNSSPTEPSTVVFTKFSQNDLRWKTDKMGISNCTLGRYGCTTSSVATLGTWFKDRLTPKDYAKCQKLYTKDGLIIWKNIPSKK